MGTVPNEVTSSAVLGDSGLHAEESDTESVDVLLRSVPAGAHSRFFVAYLVVVCLVFVFVANDTYLATPLTLMLRERLIERIGPFFSVWDLLVIGLSIYMIKVFGVRYSHSKTILRVFFVSATLCYFLNLVNPNSRDERLILGLPLIADASQYPYLLLIFTLAYISDDDFVTFLKTLLKVLAPLAIIRAIILLVLWASGKGNYGFYGVNSTLTEGDSLQIFAGLQCILLVIFLFKPRAPILFGVLVMTALQVLSFRRSGLLLMLTSDALILALHFFLTGRGTRLVKYAVAIVATTVVLYLGATIFVSQDTVYFYSARYLGMFLNFGSGQYAGDSGHFNESSATLEEALDRMSFWGYGYGDPDRIFIVGASKSIFVHNVYAAAWLYQGFYMFLFYVFIFLCVVAKLVKTIVLRRTFDSSYTLTVAGLAFFLCVMMVVWYTNPIEQAEALRVRVFWVFLFVSLFKITPESFPLFLTQSGAGEPPEN